MPETTQLVLERGALLCWLLGALLLGLGVGLIGGWLMRGSAAPLPSPVRVTPPVLTPHQTRAVVRVASPELAQWN